MQALSNALVCRLQCYTLLQDKRCVTHTYSSTDSEGTMKKLFKGFGLSLMASLIISGAALAAGGAQTGDQDGTSDQDRGRDGSCLESTPQNDTFLLFVGNGNGTGDRDGTADQDQEKDESCLDAVLQEETSLLLVRNGRGSRGTGDRDGTPDNNRDGSCING